MGVTWALTTTLLILAIARGDAKGTSHPVSVAADVFDEHCASKAECRAAATTAIADADAAATAATPDRARVRRAIGRAWVAMKRGGTDFQRFFMALEGVRKKDGVCGIPGVHS